MDDKQISSLSVTEWNIKGLHDPIFGCKLQSADFLNNLNKYDINILTETWGAVMKSQYLILKQKLFLQIK